MKMKEFGPQGARVPGASRWIRQCTEKSKQKETKEKRAGQGE